MHGSSPLRVEVNLRLSLSARTFCTAQCAAVPTSRQADMRPDRLTHAEQPGPPDEEIHLPWESFILELSEIASAFLSDNFSFLSEFFLLSCVCVLKLRPTRARIVEQERSFHGMYFFSKQGAWHSLQC